MPPPIVDLQLALETYAFLLARDWLKLPVVRVGDTVVWLGLKDPLVTEPSEFLLHVLRKDPNPPATILCLIEQCLVPMPAHGQLCLRMLFETGDVAGAFVSAANARSSLTAPVK